MSDNNIFDQKLKKGDIIGAIDQSILECDRAKQLAQETRKEIKALANRSKTIAQAALDKYPLL